MWVFKVLLWLGAILLLFIGIFGGVLDIASLVGFEIPQWASVAIAASLVALEREIKVLTLDWMLDSRRNLQKRIDKLAEFRSEVINSYYAKTPSQQEFSNWVDGFIDWEQELVTYLEKEFPYAVFEMHKDVGIKPLMDFEHVSNDPALTEQHLHYLRMIAKHLSILESLIAKYTGITKDREPSLKQLFSTGPSG
jgi:hypothetical protein